MVVDVADGLTFKLSDEFIEPYRFRKVDWGYPMPPATPSARSPSCAPTPG
jgi:hypothetical protein